MATSKIKGPKVLDLTTLTPSTGWSFNVNALQEAVINDNIVTLSYRLDKATDDATPYALYLPSEYKPKAIVRSLCWSSSNGSSVALVTVETSGELRFRQLSGSAPLAGTYGGSCSYPL